LFFLQSDSTVAFRFLLGFDVHAESVERRCRQVRRILESAPVDRRTQAAERAVDRGDLVSAPVLGFEAQDLARFLQRRDRQRTETALHGFQSPVDRAGAA
jgi:hypothetical protein